MAKRGQADLVLRFFLEEHTEAEVAAILNIDVRTLRRWRKRGVPKKKYGEAVQFEYRVKHEFDQIETMLRDAQQCTAELLGNMPMVRVVRNKDGTIDGQLTIYDIPRGVKARQTMLRLSHCASALKNLDAWLQVGMRWGAVGTDKPPDSGDRRVRGLAEGTTYWYTSARYGDLFAYALGGRVGKKRIPGIMGNVEAKRGNRKIETIFIRVHWNKEGRQPGR